MEWPFTSQDKLPREGNSLKWVLNLRQIANEEEEKGKLVSREPLHKGKTQPGYVKHFDLLGVGGVRLEYTVGSGWNSSCWT